jgi:hypothetical protein
MLALSRALLATASNAESLYREAIQHLSHPTTTAQLAAPTCSTANGCAANAGAATPANTCPPPANSSPAWG